MNKPLIFDGAFGTYHYALTGEGGLCELANLTEPDLVRRIHREYLAAGSRAVRTNTFAANPVTVPDPEKLLSVWKAGVALAREASEPYGAEVFASIGCVTDKALCAFSYRACAEIALTLGVRRVLFETLDSLEGIPETVAFLKERDPGITVWVSVASGQDGTTDRGLSAVRMIEEARTFADAAGFNCKVGPAHLAYLLKLLPESRVPLIALPNAGYPASVGGRTVFENNPEYFASASQALALAGADVIGGCCGTTPRHIEELCRVIAKSVPAEEKIQREEKPRTVAPVPPLKGRGKKYLAVEIDPPVDADPSFFLSAARDFVRAGADAVTVSDSPFSKTRADALLCAARLVQEGVPAVIPHITCRDKNHVALKGGLLAANFSGIDRVFAVTGDPPLKGENVRHSGVFSFNSFELISFIRSLNEEVFYARPFSVGAALNVNVENFEKELSRARKKETCGADFFLTQPVFSEAARENFLEAKRALKVPVLCGIMPVAGYKNARFLKNEVPGTGVPQSLIDALEGKEPEEVKKISLAEACRTIDFVYEAADGFFLMLPRKKADYITDLIRYIRKKEEEL